jgi:hypothetical protein
MSRCISLGCLWGVVATTWVEMYHGLFINSGDVQQENEVMQMSAIKVDLNACLLKLVTKESDLTEKIQLLTIEARTKQRNRDTVGAKRKLTERRRCQEQLVRIANSICIMDSHSNALEGTELNKSILNTIRASGDAIKKLSVKGGMDTVEDIISEVATQMENASDISKILSTGSDHNSMFGSDHFNDTDLEDELRELLEDAPIRHTRMPSSLMTPYSAIPTLEEEEEEEETDTIERTPLHAH